MQRHKVSTRVRVANSVGGNPVYDKRLEIRLVGGRVRFGDEHNWFELTLRQWARLCGMHNLVLTLNSPPTDPMGGLFSSHDFDPDTRTFTPKRVRRCL